MNWLRRCRKKDGIVEEIVEKLERRDIVVRLPESGQREVPACKARLEVLYFMIIQVF